MGFKQFSLYLGFRLTFLILTLLGFSFAYIHPGYYALTLLLFIISLTIVYELYRYLTKTNVLLARFFESARYNDCNQTFSFTRGAGFNELSNSLSRLLEDIHIKRQHQEEELRHLKSFTEHIPIPLLSLFPDDTIQLQNNASRRLLGQVNITHLRDLRLFGTEFYETVKNLEPGKRKVVYFSSDGNNRQLTVLMTQIISGGKREKLISLHDIQSELDDVQLQSWQELLRVLTHEMMNSINPVASLAKTSVLLVDDLYSHPEKMIEKDELIDIRDSLETISRRSNSLLKFVQNYRSITLLPSPKKHKIDLSQLFSRVSELFDLSFTKNNIKFKAQVQPQNLTAFADAGLIEQVLINLLKNAEDALQQIEHAEISLTAHRNQCGKIIIFVNDNGFGIPEEISKKVFIPFFTTKSNGSGVGLALARQIMVAHGGDLNFRSLPSGGTQFTLSF